MKKRIISICKKLIPDFIYVYLPNANENKFKKEVYNYYSNSKESEIKDCLRYMKRNRLHYFLYEFAKKYKKKDITVYKDEDLGLSYVVSNGKRLYMKRNLSEKKIKELYNFLLIEQDKDSAHRYLTETFNVEEGDILADIGAAEGNLSLDVVDRVKRIYLFEVDEDWIEALTASFAPWKEKVFIINKFVSGKNDDKNVSLDVFFKDKPLMTFLKIDVEGSEDQVLSGAMEIIRNNSLKLALCCYHKPYDEIKLKEWVDKNGFSSEFSNGFIFFRNDPQPPYLRKALIRARK